MKNFLSYRCALLGALLSGLSGAGCEASDPGIQHTLIVSISELSDDIHTLRLTAIVGDAQRVREYDAAPVLGMPLPQEASGQVQLLVSGLDAAGCLLRSGQNSAQVSGEERVYVSLQLGALPGGQQLCGGACAAGYTDCDGDTQTNGCETRGVCIFDLQAAQRVGAFSDSKGVAVGDFDRDNKPDLVVVSTPTIEFSGSVSVFLGNGDGTFQSLRNFNVGHLATAVAVGDFDGDGKPDLAVANADPMGGNVSVFLGNGDGTFQTARDIPFSVTPSSIVVGDFDGDGKLDLGVANTGETTAGVLLGNGNGTFQAARDFDVSGSSSVAMGDFDGDGKSDLAVANDNANTVVVLLSKGSRVQSFAVGINPVSVAVGDFDGDGKPDLAVANSYVMSSSVSVLLGKGDGSFANARSFAAGNSPSSVTVEDVNGN